MRNRVLIPEECRKMGYTRPQLQMVLRSILSRINIPLGRSRTCYLKVQGLGIIFTHGNCKQDKKNYQTKYQKKLWKKQLEKKEFSEKRLLF